MEEQNSSISSFRRFSVRILLPLILIVCIVGIVCNNFFEKKLIFSCELCGAYKVHRILTETHPGEIPIFGSSRVEGGFIPDSLGSEFFNYGLSGTKYNVTLFFLEEECRKSKLKPWILIGLDLNGITYGLGDIANYIPSANYRSVQHLLGKKHIFYYSVPFIKYYGRFEGYTRDILNSKIQLTRFTNKGAALERNELHIGEFKSLVEKRKKQKTSFFAEPTLCKQLLRIISTNKNRTFIFVIPPYHASYFENYVNIDEAEQFLNMLRANNNVKVFDFSRMPLPDSMFLNTTHINYKGAILFSHRLKDSLVSIGVR